MADKSEICKKYISRLGNSVKIINADGSEINFFAAVEQTWRKNKSRFEFTSSELGRVRNDYYIYFGPCDVDITALDEKAILICDEKEYCFVVSHKVCSNDEVLYYTGVLKRIYREDGNVFE